MKTTRSSSDTDHASSSSDTSPDEARFKRANRLQVEMITLSLNQRLDVDHPVRAVRAFVEGLDLTELYGKIKAVKGKPGAGAIDPRILFALWIYATLRGIESGRRIDEVCHPQQGKPPINGSAVESPSTIIPSTIFAPLIPNALTDV